MKADDLLDDRYRLERILGEGAMARAWLAEDEEEGKKVVVKEVPLSRLRGWKDLDLFRREAELLTELRHRGIPQCFDHFMDDEDPASRTFYLVEEWIDGESLLSVLERRLKLPEREVRHIVRELAEILYYLHVREVPIIHRDIKPSNVMVRRDTGELVLIDFGAVREMAHNNEDGSTIAGTFGYMPPEQLHGRATPASDVYALAATACHLMCGTPPKDMPLKGAPFMLDFRPRANASEDFAQLIDSMLQPEVDERLWDIEQVIELLEEIEETAAPAEDLEPSATGALARMRPGPRSLETDHYLYALALAPTWRYATMLVGLLLAFTGPVGWLVTAVTLLIGGMNFREAWANTDVLGGGTIIGARVAAKRPGRFKVELEYKYTFKRRTYQATISVRPSLVRDVQIGSIIEVAIDPKSPEDSVPLLGDVTEITKE